MTTRYMPFSLVPIALFILLGGCATAPAPERVEDTRLDHLISNMDQSLANQTVVKNQLQQQRQQLELQQHNIEILSQDIGNALKTPVEVNCPEVAACPPVTKASGKSVVGALEKVWLSDLNFALIARIDTGVETSSLDASNIEQFERDGNSWVRFEILNPETEEPVSIERRLARTLGIVKSGSSKSKRRPVVKMNIVIGDIEQTAEFSLRDRSHESYQALIGRSILKDVMLVDVSKKNIAPYVLPETSSDSDGKSK